MVLALAACRGSDRARSTPTHPPASGTPTRASTGPAAVVLRVPRSGGIARVYNYESLDSAIWTSQGAAPAVARVLAFDDDGGAVAVVDQHGAPRRIELRTGSISPPPSVKLTALHSADGAAVYGIGLTGIVTRLTPTDVRPWTLHPPSAARDVAPQPDGTLLIVGDGHDATTVWRVRPPAPALLDTAVLPRAERLLRAGVGDRAYFASDSALQPVRTNDLKLGPAVRFKRKLRAFAATPSGDRLYVALDSTNQLRVIDRYSGSDDATVDLPGPAAELRMDSLGRYLLVRPARISDSAWVVTLGTSRVTGTVKTAWSADLPFVGVDGSIVLSQAPDVVFVDPETLAPRRTVAGGALDFWIPLRWNGFRPRAPGLDQPVTFPNASADSSDSILQAIRRSQSDTSLHATPQTGGATTPAPDTSPRVAPTGAAAAVRPPGGTPIHSPVFTVQLAAILNPDSARARAARISAGGQRARVVAATRGGSTVYLVVLGPYPSRDAAEEAGRQSAQPNPWIYEGAP
jgi:cell division septation protein DedD